MTEFKANIILASSLYLVGNSLLDRIAGTELSNDLLMQIAQWGGLVAGYGLLMGSICVATVAAARKIEALV